MDRGLRRILLCDYLDDAYAGAVYSLEEFAGYDCHVVYTRHVMGWAYSDGFTDYTVAVRVWFRVVGVLSVWR